MVKKKSSSKHLELFYIILTVSTEYQETEHMLKPFLTRILNLLSEKHLAA